MRAPATFLLMFPLLAQASDCRRAGDSIHAAGFEKPALRVRYVATDGDDAAAGGMSSPWRSIQTAADRVEPGDAVCVRGGLYAELVTVTRSGSDAAGAIVFDAVPSETPVIEGTGLPIPNGQNGLVTLVDVSHVVVRGFELREYATASTANVPIGLYLTGAGSDVRILDNEIHAIRNTGAGCAANAFGLKVDGTRAPESIRRLTIAGNDIHDLVLGCSESFSLDGNVEQWTISGNRVHDTNNIAIGAIGFEGVAPDPAVDQARDGTIVGNLVYNVSSFGNPAYGSEYAADGIYVDGGTRILIERNVVHHVDIGIELASEHAARTTSAVIARDNLVYAGNSAGISLGGYAAEVGGTQGCTVVNNTLLRNDRRDTGSGEIQVQYHATGNTIANNIVHAGAQGLVLNVYTGEAAPPAILDHNLYFSDAGAGGSSWVWHGTSYDSLADYVAAAAQDAHARFADPLFVSTGAPDLHVAATSPAVDAGMPFAPAIVGTIDFDGRPRVAGAAIDVGAYER